MKTDQGERPAAFFVGDHLALDFVNTRCKPAGAWVEWLGDGRDLVDWLERAGAIDATVAARFQTGAAASRRLDAVAGQARGLREWLHAFVERHGGRELEADALAELAPLNQLLAEDDGYLQVAAADGGSLTATGLVQHRLRRWTSARAAAAADRRGDRRSGLQRGFPPGSRLRGLGMHARVPGPDQGPCPSLVQHGGLRQSREGRGPSSPDDDQAALTPGLARASPCCTIQAQRCGARPDHSGKGRQPRERARLRPRGADGEHPDGVRQRHRAAQRQFRGRRQRDRRPDRRQRRRQVHLDQDRHRRAQADRRPPLHPRPAGRPGAVLGARRPRPADRGRAPGKIAGRQAAAVAQPVRRPPDHQPLRLHRRQAREGGREPAAARADRLSRRRHRCRFRPSASCPAASARASRSDVPCISTPT